VLLPNFSCPILNSLKTLKYLFAALMLVSSLSTFAQSGFVKVEGTQFTLDGKPYRYVGANYWYGGLLATNGEAGKKRLRTELDFLKMHGVTNLRIMVGAEGITTYKFRTPSEKSLQPEAGKFDENIAIGLDYLLNELGKRNMKAVPGTGAAVWSSIYNGTVLARRHYPNMAIIAGMPFSIMWPSFTPARNARMSWIPTLNLY
jgi:hypothetical protein